MQKKYVPFLLLILIGVIAYTNSLFNSIAYDDVSVLKDNSFITSFKNIPDFFNHSYFEKAQEKSYRPVITLTYMADYFLWKKIPFGYHLTNLIFHLLTVIVMYLLGLRLLKNKTAVLIGAILFAVHPALTESVCSISFREDVLCALFVWIAVYGYIKYRQDDKPVWLGVVLPAYFIGLFTKEMAAAFIPIIFLYELVYREKTRSKPVLISAITAISLITLFFMFVRFISMNNPDDSFSTAAFNIFIMIKVLLTYLKLFYFPITLRVLYYEHYLLHYNHEILLCSIAVAVLVLSAIRTQANQKAVLFLSAVSIAGFVPVLNIYPIRHLAAERYMYLPAVSFIFFMAITLFGNILNKRIMFSLFIVCVMLFVSLTITRSSIWKNNYSLWYYAAHKDPWVVEAHYSLGHAYQMRKQIDEAVKEYKIALRLQPDYFDAHVNLGRAYVEQKMFSEAVYEYRKALELKQDNPMLHYNMGIAYDKLHEDKKALSHFMRALALKPDYNEVYGSLGGFFITRNDFKGAEFYWLKAIEINPDYVQGYANLGSLYANFDDFTKARYYWKKALKIKPNYRKVLNDLYILEKTSKENKKNLNNKKKENSYADR
ncbi:tetratricopeptide repeat protein [bacterium]|nr:tetratricopeptide repeat protein [bacterium]